MITIFNSIPGNEGVRGEPIVHAESIDAALDQVVDRVTEDEPELMALAEDLRFIKDPSPGRRELESGFVMVVD